MLVIYLFLKEESQIFEGLDPLNATITVGMDAVFNCKVKSSNQPNIKVKITFFSINFRFKNFILKFLF